MSKGTAMPEVYEVPRGKAVMITRVDRNSSWFGLSSLLKGKIGIVTNPGPNEITFAALPFDRDLARSYPRRSCIHGNSINVSADVKIVEDPEGNWVLPQADDGRED